VVSIALIVSWFVAVIFAPLLGVIILTPPKAAKTAGPGRIYRWYRNFLALAMRAKWVTIFVSLALFVGSFLALLLIPRQFFPSSDRPELLVDLSLPQNASIYASETAAQRLEAAALLDMMPNHAADAAVLAPPCEDGIARPASHSGRRACLALAGDRCGFARRAVDTVSDGPERSAA
jgi:multidrug efflux pump subunit AcrB